jgi:hypothetical protein
MMALIAQIEPAIWEPIRNELQRIALLRREDDVHVGAPNHPWQEQQLLLNARRQIQQVHDLGDACPCHIPQPGQFRVIGLGA